MILTLIIIAPSPTVHCSEKDVKTAVPSSKQMHERIPAQRLYPPSLYSIDIGTLIANDCYDEALYGFLVLRAAILAERRTKP